MTGRIILLCIACMLGYLPAHTQAQGACMSCSWGEWSEFQGCYPTSPSSYTIGSVNQPGYRERYRRLDSITPPGCGIYGCSGSSTEKIYDCRAYMISEGDVGYIHSQPNMTYEPNTDMYIALYQRDRIALNNGIFDDQVDSRERKYYFTRLSFPVFDLQLKSDTLCGGCCDYVRITLRNSNKVVGTYCGNTLPPPIYDYVDNIDIEFHTDGTNQFGGFIAKYESYSFFNYRPGFSFFSQASQSSVFQCIGATGNFVHLRHVAEGISMFELDTGIVSSSVDINLYYISTPNIVWYVVSPRLKPSSRITSTLRKIRGFWYNCGANSNLDNAIGSLGNDRYDAAYLLGSLSSNFDVDQGTIDDINNLGGHVQLHPVDQNKYTLRTNTQDGYALSGYQSYDPSQGVPTAEAFTNDTSVVYSQLWSRFEYACGKGFFLYYNGKCYNQMLNNEGIFKAANYSRAQQMCALYGGHILEITNPYYHKFFENFLAYNVSGPYFWVGLEKHENASCDWYYPSTGKKVDYHFGWTKQENHHDCVAYDYTNKTYLTLDCSSQLYYACELPTADSQIIMNRNFDMETQYSQNATEYETVTVGPDHIIRLEFKYIDIQPSSPTYCSGCCDYVEVYNKEIDGPLAGQFCGKAMPRTVYSTDRKLGIHFHSNDDGEKGHGFTAVASAISVACSMPPTLHENLRHGYIASPGFGTQGYTMHQSCGYLIKVGYGLKIHLEFQNEFEIKTQDNSDLCEDYLDIYDGENTTAPLFGRFCGRELPPNLHSSSNMMYMEFHTGEHAGYEGFFVHYTTSCNKYTRRKAFTDSWFFETPRDFRDNTLDLLECFYETDLPSGLFVHPTGHQLDIEDSEDCANDGLKLILAGYDIVTKCETTSGSLIGRQSLDFMYYSDEFKTADYEIAKFGAKVKYISSTHETWGVDCAPGWNSLSHHCYKTYECPKNWHDAAAECERNNAELFVPRDLEAIDAFGRSAGFNWLIRNSNFKYAWIGIKDSGNITSHDWRLPDGTVATEFSWAVGYPTDANNMKCVHQQMNYIGGTYDLLAQRNDDCERKLPFMCLTPFSTIPAYPQVRMGHPLNISNSDHYVSPYHILPVEIIEFQYVEQSSISFKNYGRYPMGFIYQLAERPVEGYFNLPLASSECSGCCQYFEVMQALESDYNNFEWDNMLKQRYCGDGWKTMYTGTPFAFLEWDLNKSKTKGFDMQINSIFTGQNTAECYNMSQSIRSGDLRLVDANGDLSVTDGYVQYYDGSSWQYWCEDTAVGNETALTEVCQSLGFDYRLGDCSSYYGCFAMDIGDFSLGILDHVPSYVAYTDNINNTMSGCIQACKDAGYPYAGTQHRDCHCGYADDFGREHSDGTGGKCRGSCPGDSNQKCGFQGEWRVYETGFLETFNEEAMCGNENRFYIQCAACTLPDAFYRQTHGGRHWFASPYYGNDLYPSGHICDYNLHVPDHMRIMLTLENLQGVPSANGLCNDDRLVVYEGYNSSHNPIGEYCSGNQPSGPILSQGNTMLVRFHSFQDSTQDQGFLFTHVGACHEYGDTFMLDKRQHEFSRVNGYHDMNCFWKVKVPSERYVIEIEFDESYFNEGSHLHYGLGEIPGQQLLGHFHEDKSTAHLERIHEHDTVWFYYYGGYHISNYGFDKAKDKYNMRVSAFYLEEIEDNYSGHLALPDHMILNGHYDNNFDGIWHVKSPEPGLWIRVDFLEFNVRSSCVNGGSCCDFVYFEQGSVSDALNTNVRLIREEDKICGSKDMFHPIEHHDNEYEEAIYQDFSLVSATADIISLGAGPAGIWVIDAQNKVYYRKGTYEHPNINGTDWQEIAFADGDLVQIDVGTDIVWATVSDNTEPFYRAGISHTNPAGTAWVQSEPINFMVRQVSVPPNNVFWVIGLFYKLNYRDGVLSSTLQGTGYIGPVDNTNTYNYVSAGRAGVWAIRRTNNFLYYIAEDGTTKGSIMGNMVTTVAVGDHMVLAISNNHLYALYGISSDNKDGLHWVNLGQTNLTHLEFDNPHGAIWGIDSNENVTYGHINHYPEYDYRGCWDNYESAIHDLEYEVEDVDVIGDVITIPKCVKACYDRAFKFAGVQGPYCRCSNTYGSFTEHPDECTSPCLGDRVTSCGSSDRISVYGSGFGQLSEPLYFENEFYMRFCTSLSHTDIGFRAIFHIDRSPGEEFYREAEYEYHSYLMSPYYPLGYPRTDPDYYHWTIIPLQGHTVRFSFVDQYHIHDSINCDEAAVVIGPWPPTGLMMYGGDAYLWILEPELSWSDAVGDCAARGGQLADGYSQDFKDWLPNIVPAASSINYFWIGLTDSASEGTWRNLDDQIPTYIFWQQSPLQPNGGTGENCAAPDRGRGYGAFDRPCEDSYPYLCQFKSIVSIAHNSGDKHCGRSKPDDLLFTSSDGTDQFSVTFGSTVHSPLNIEGFKILYTLEKHFVNSDRVHHFSSPLTEDGVYPEHYQFSWIKELDADKRIKLSFSHFDLSTTECNGHCCDYISYGEGVVPGKDPIVSHHCSNMVPAVFYSPEDTLWLTMNAVTNSATGIIGTMKTVMTRELSGLNGEFGSDNKPYFNDAETAWLITVPEGYFIRLYFTSFVLDDNLCDGECCDYVMIGDGHHLHAKNMKYCSTNMPPVLYSAGNKMWVILSSDSSVNEDGFSAVFDAVSSVCETPLVVDASRPGFIATPGFNGTQPDEEDFACVYQLTTIDGQVIKINFMDIFELIFDSETLACIDAIEIYDGDDTSSPLIGRFCGNNMPGIIVSTGKHLHIEFHRASRERREILTIADVHGFIINYASMPRCSQIVSGPTGSINSANFFTPSGLYEANTLCTWVLEVPVNHVIKMTFNQDFAIERDIETGNCIDYVEIRNYGVETLGETSDVIGERICGAVYPDPLYSTSNMVYLLFYTNSENQYRGYKIDYESIDGFYSGIRGTITSPGFPTPYLNHLETVWTIEAPVDHRIYLYLLTLDIESCGTSCNCDWLRVFDGNDESTLQLGTDVCGTEISQDFYSTGRMMTLRFHSDGESQNNPQGFSAFWYAFVECEGELTVSKGAIFSPSYPNNYPPDSDCHILIHAPKYHQIVMNFHHLDMQPVQCPTECCDYVDVADGSHKTSPTIAGHICGETYEPTIYSEENGLFVHFISNDQEEGTGYKAFFYTYQEILYFVADVALQPLPRYIPAHFHEPHGEFSIPSHPLYPGVYANDLDLYWFIELDEMYSVKLEFYGEYNLRPVDSCEDRLRIYEMVDGVEQEIGEPEDYCQNTAPEPLYSCDNHMKIWFHSNLANRGRGFNARYSTIQRIFHEDMNTFQSLHHPLAFPSGFKEKWLIQLKPWHYINLRFTAWDVSYPYCPGHIMIGEGTNTTDIEEVYCHIRHYCGPNPGPIYSGGHELWIRWETLHNNNISATGWSATYTSEPRVLTDPTGHINSPGYPNNYPAHKSRSWKIVAPGGYTVRIVFDHFDMSGHDYVAIGDGEDITYNQTRHLYGDHAYSPIYSASNALWVAFYSYHDSDTASGFRLHYRFEKRIFNTPTGIIVSPIDEFYYVLNFTGLWYINVPYQKRVNVTITMKSLPDENPCKSAVMEVGNLHEDWMYRCGPGHNGDTFHSHGSHVPIRLVTEGNDISRQRKTGFTITYSILLQPGDCHFEQTLCNYRNTGVLPWQIYRGPSGKTTTGPLTGRYLVAAPEAEGDRYLIVFAENYNHGQSAVLTSEVLKPGRRSLSFSYHMKGTQIGTLTIYVTPVDGVRSPVWSRTGQQGDHWMMAHSIPVSEATYYTITFEVILGSGEIADSSQILNGDIAIDDIYVTTRHAYDDHCDKMLCRNGGLCYDVTPSYNEDGFVCQCAHGFSGPLCQYNDDNCRPGVCLNGGTCFDQVDDTYKCGCAVGWTGDHCDVEVDDCNGNMCLNGALCIDGDNAYTCDCDNDFYGDYCEHQYLPCDTRGDPCGAVDKRGECIDGIGPDVYYCQCHPDYVGSSCEEARRHHCNGNPCNTADQNALCIDLVHNFTCRCSVGFTGLLCTTDLDECDGITCHNGGYCSNLIDEFRCTCVGDYEGEFCQNKIDDCISCDPVGTKWCNDGVNNFECVCKDGYGGRTCDTDINDCAFEQCFNGGTCHDKLGGYECSCRAGYTGVKCEQDINECLSNPCINRGTCSQSNTSNSYICYCPSGFADTHCETNINDCSPGNCQNGGTCFDLVNDYVCRCLPDYEGNNCQNQMNDCIGNQCINGATCIDGVMSFRCKCPQGFYGEYCEQTEDRCKGHHCEHGTCEPFGDSYRCNCDPGYNGIHCELDINECSVEPCSNHATCIQHINSYTCLCPKDYEGNHCQTRIDNCVNNICTNNATCVDGIEEYSCECIHGYGDSHCDVMLNLCDNNPCHFGLCIDHFNSYECLCNNGYEGQNCDTNINDCQDVVCLNGGVCKDLVGGHVCTCPHGFHGDTCEHNFDNCDPNPCQNNAFCVDKANWYECLCRAGFEGYLCEVNINECMSNPCLHGHCIDLVNSYKCECQAGYEGHQCDVNIDDCSSNPCQNEGVCYDSFDSFICICPSGTGGDHCQDNHDDCNAVVCQNGAICEDGLNDFHCRCQDGFYGTFCEIDMNSLLGSAVGASGGQTGTDADRDCTFGNSTESIIFIVAVVVGAVLLIIICVIISQVIISREKKRQAKIHHHRVEQAALRVMTIPRPSPVSGHRHAREYYD